jgi:hypothetical protein
MKFLFTFGHGQPWFPGFHEIEAATPEAAREIMVERFGQRWSMQYPGTFREQLEQTERREIGYAYTGPYILTTPEELPEK